MAVAVVVAGAFAACTPPTQTNGTSPTPQFSSGLTPLVFFSVSPTPTIDAPPCDYPAKIGMPTWLPNDLPFPEGMYASQHLDDSYGYHRGIFVLPTSLQDFTSFVLDQWPASGWTLGRGDAEPGEIEDQFTKSPAVGAFKAQSVFCNPGYAVMIVIYAPDSSKAGAAVTQNHSPLPGASPSFAPSP